MHVRTRPTEAREGGRAASTTRRIRHQDTGGPTLRLPSPPSGTYSHTPYQYTRTQVKHKHAYIMPRPPIRKQLTRRNHQLKCHLTIASKIRHYTTTRATRCSMTKGFANSLTPPGPMTHARSLVASIGWIGELPRGCALANRICSAYTQKSLTPLG